MDYPSALKADAKMYAAFFREMLRSGIYLPPSQFEAAFLRTAHTDEDVEKTLDAAEKAMRILKN